MSTGRNPTIAHHPPCLLRSTRTWGRAAVDTPELHLITLATPLATPHSAPQTIAALALVLLPIVIVSAVINLRLRLLRERARQLRMPRHDHHRDPSSTPRPG
ncbi:hypothetical protein [Herbiconiux daphne]|uniref:Uncharacterized protein n=1 Tax=Herbiconiux daphne TaxID=2970914 RepID=A0ABT2H1A4_9MICO|nr:hypothetical protein [Herbiconiux daphne]MCS5733710.1 hypothetical protein [Herbiconiux daphne]